MEVINIKIEKLNPAKYNPRLDLQPEDKEYQDIKRSIVEFGLVEPLVVNKDMTVIGGHQRLKVLRDLNFTTIPCIIVDLNKQKEKMLNIALNKISGDWDRAKLKDILEELDTGEFDMNLTGWNEQEIEDLMTEFHVEPEEDNFDVDKAIEEVGEPICKRGDIWQLGNHRIMCGDSTIKEDVEKLMDGEKADMVFTDPPYGIKVVHKHTIGGGGAFGGKKNLAKDSSNFIKANNYSEVYGDETTETAQLNYQICKELGFENFIIWGGNYFADFLPANRGWVCWDKIDGVEGTTKNFSDIELAWTSYDVPARIVRHRWQGLLKASEHKDKRCHPTQKPIALAVECFSLYKAGDVIVDFFLGSGSTLIACEQLNRICYGMEIDPVYSTVIIDRYIKFKNSSEDVFLLKDKQKIPYKKAVKINGRE